MVLSLLEFYCQNSLMGVSEKKALHYMYYIIWRVEVVSGILRYIFILSYKLRFLSFWAKFVGHRQFMHVIIKDFIGYQVGRVHAFRWLERERELHVSSLGILWKIERHFR